MNGMRRLCVLLLAACLVPPAVALARDSGPNDGSLVITHASGSLVLTGKGLMFGHVDRGTVTVLSYKPEGNSVPTVSGAKMKLVGNSINVVYTGSDVRFLFPGGRYSIEIDGTNVDVSAIGKGRVSALGAGSADDGSVVADGGTPQPLGKLPMVALWGAGGSAGPGAGPGASSGLGGSAGGERSTGGGKGSS
jgi:hypothetical protein